MKDSITVKRGMEQITNASQLKAILEPIPEGQWCAGILENSQGQRCALGHLNSFLNKEKKILFGLFKENDPNYTQPFDKDIGVDQLIRNYEDFLGNEFIGSLSLIQVNDGKISKYQEYHPKARVIHFINDMIEAGF